MQPATLQIGQLAKLSDISVDTLRYYEKHGLLQPCGRSAGGYRLYDHGAVAQLRFIQRAKSVGFSLSDIAELLSLKIEKDQHSCQEVKNLTEAKLQAVEQKLEQLLRIRSALQQLNAACCGGPESAEHCSILEALETGHINHQTASTGTDHALASER